MTKEDIKKNTSMLDVIRRYGFHTKRDGFMSCPFHQGDHTASMKIYGNNFHCYGCGADGDIFTFVMLMENVGFKEAFKILGGEYEHTKAAAVRTYFNTHPRPRERARGREGVHQSEALTLYDELIEFFKPTDPDCEYPDMWVDLMNKRQICEYEEVKT